MKNEPVLITMSILAALQVAAGSLALTDLVSSSVIGIIIVCIAALQGGLQFYVRGQVTPVEMVQEAIYVPRRALTQESVDAEVDQRHPFTD
jgi:hypothetical protein